MLADRVAQGVREIAVQKAAQHAENAIHHATIADATLGQATSLFRLHETQPLGRLLRMWSGAYREPPKLVTSPSQVAFLDASRAATLASIEELGLARGVLSDAHGGLADARRLFPDASDALDGVLELQIGRFGLIDELRSSVVRTQTNGSTTWIGTPRGRHEFSREISTSLDDSGVYIRPRGYGGSKIIDTPLDDVRRVHGLPKLRAEASIDFQVTNGRVRELKSVTPSGEIPPQLNRRIAEFGATDLDIAASLGAEYQALISREAEELRAITGDRFERMNGLLGIEAPRGTSAGAGSLT